MPASQETMTMFCRVCDDVLEDGSPYDGAHEHCVDELLWECEACNTVYVQDSSGARQVADVTGYRIRDSYYSEDGWTLCEQCIYCCEHCDSVYGDEDNAYNCCPSVDDSVHSYSYRPAFKFYDDRTAAGDKWSRQHTPKPDVLYMGVELEMVRVANCADDFVVREMEDVSDPNFFYFKEDGSVGYDGAELVTMPATLEQFAARFPFDTLDWARNAYRVRSFEYESCGFHIHVSRSAFSPTHMWRFVMLQLKNPSLCQRVGQRESSTYATWFWDDSERDSIPQFVKGKRTNGRRYLAINFQNRQTVELRYFKGNILRSAILKNVQFVHSMYEYTKHMTYKQVLAGALSEQNYLDWLSTQPGYDELKQYLMDVDNGGM